MTPGSGANKKFHFKIAIIMISPITREIQRQDKSYLAFKKWEYVLLMIERESTEIKRFKIN